MSQTILIVDDEPAIPKALKEFLEDTGVYDVVMVPSGEEGIEVLGGREIAACIVDMRLPGMSGDEFILRAHAVRPGCRFIIHTGCLGYAPPKELKGLGVTTAMVVNKPVLDMGIFLDLIAPAAGMAAGAPSA